MTLASLYTCCMALYISGTFARAGATSCVHEPGRSRSALYTRSMIPKTHMPVHQAMGSTLGQPKSSYTCCKSLYISGNWVQRGENSCVRKYGRSRGALYTKFTIPKMHTPVHQAMGCILAQMASLYTCCTAVYTSNTFARTGATSYEHKCVRSRGALYTRCMIPKPHTPVHQSIGNNLA